MNTTTSSFPWKKIIHIAVMFFLMFFFEVIPAPNGVSEYGMTVLGIFLGLIYGWTMFANNMTFTALLAMFALGITDFGTAANVMAKSFGSESVVLLMVSMFMVGTIQEAGISEYLAAKIVTLKFAKGKPWITTFLLVMTPFILSMFINALVIALFLSALYINIFKQVGYKAGEKYPTMVLFAVFIGALLAPSMFPFKGWPLVPLGSLYGATGVAIDYGSYMIMSIPYMFITMFGYVLLMRLLRCDASKMATADFSAYEEKYQYGLTKYQKAVIVSVVGMLFGSIAISFLGGQTGVRLLFSKTSVYGWMMLVCAIMLFVTVEGKPLMSMAVSAKYVSWDMIFVVASATCISGALTSAESGFSAFLTSLLAPILANMSAAGIVIALIAIALVLTNIFNNLAVTFILLAVVGSLYSSGVPIPLNACAVVLSIFPMIGIVTPAASAYGAMLHSNEFTTAKSLYIYGSIVVLYMILVGALVFGPVITIL